MQGHAWNAFHNFEMHFKGGNRCIPSVQLTVMNLSIVVNIFFSLRGCFKRPSALMPDHGCPSVRWSHQI